MNNLKLKIKNLALDSKIFVAGGTGLVGSAIIKNLLEKGYTNIISNYRNRQPNNSTLNTNSVQYIKLDLLDTLAVSEFFKQNKPEFVFLAAAKVGGIVANNTYRADFIYENLQIQNNVIHQSYVHKVKKLLFLGSTCIYPKNAPQPMPENCLLTSSLEYTNEPYAIAKIAGIKMCESYNIQYGTNFISVMPTNLYGPNDNFDLETSHVLPALIRKIHLGKCLEENNWEAIKEDLNKNPIEGINGSNSENKILEKLNSYGIEVVVSSELQVEKENTTNNRLPTTHNKQSKIAIEIWGSGNPRREFLYSEDMADACVFIMENRNFQDIVNQQLASSKLQVENCKTTQKELPTTHHTLHTEVRNTHINIGTGKDISIKELAELIKNIIGFKGELYFNTEKPDGTMKKLTDVSKLNSLGWKYKMDLESGIKEMYKWYLQ